MERFDEIEVLVLARRIGLMNQALVSKYLDLGMVAEAKQLMAEDAELMSLFEWKAGYNPSQPRLPAGSPNGGQWTSGGGGVTGSTAKRKYPKPKVGKPLKVKDPRTGKIPDRVNIFIGGAGDQTQNHNVEDSHTLHRDVYGRNYYFTHDDGDKIKKLIDSLPKFFEINVIGHSWGGDTAADVINKSPSRARTLVTVDPVSHGRPDYSEVSKNTDMWINIYATGNPKTSSIGDFSAFIGGHWGNSPESDADIFIEVPVIHEAFDAMLNYHGTYDSTGKLLSTRDILVMQK